MKLEQLLKGGRFVVTSEIHVPAGRDPRKVCEESAQLRDWADVLRIKLSPQDHSPGHLAAMCRALRAEGFALELEVNTRNQNRIEIAKILIDGCDAGVENFLIFTQDYWISGDSVQETMFFHVDMGKFFSVTETLSQGLDVDGQGLDGAKELFIGAGIDPRFGKNIPDMQLREMEVLAEQGIGYFVTKPVFDPDAFEGFMSKVARLKVPVIAEVVMLQSASEAFLMNSMSWINIPRRLIERIEKAEMDPDATHEITLEIIQRLRELCSGIHLLPYGDIGRIAPMLASLKG